MASSPTLSFRTLTHALSRRSQDHIYFLTSISPPTPGLRFSDLKTQLSYIEAALNHSPPFLPSEVRDGIIKTLTQIQVEAVNLNRDIEMNPFRVQRGAMSVKSEESLDGIRTECFGSWEGCLGEIWDEILKKSERKLHKNNLKPVLEGK